MYRLALLLFGFRAFSSYGEEHLHGDLLLALFELPGVLQPHNHTLPYNRLIKHIKDVTPYTLETQFLPYSRAEKMLVNRQLDCMFPVVKGESTEQLSSFYSNTVNHVAVYLFSLDRPLQSFTEISDQAALRLSNHGFGYWSLTGEEHANWIAVDSRETALRIMQSGRAAAFIDYYPDIKVALSEEDFKRVKFSAKHPINRLEDAVECSDVNKTRVFVSWLNDELLRLNQSGELQQILGEFYNRH